MIIKSNPFGTVLSFTYCCYSLSLYGEVLYHFMCFTGKSYTAISGRCDRSYVGFCTITEK